MNVVGLLEADFQGGREYTAGGMGPLFREKRMEERYSVWELLARCADALAKMNIVDVVSLFIDDEEIIFPEPESGEADAGEGETDEDGAIEFDIADEAQRAYGEGDPVSFLLLLTYDDKQFSHVISIEASSDHDFEDAAMSVLDRATPAAEDEYDEDGALQDAVEAFLQKLQAELDKELALQEPEIDIWYEDSVQGGLTGETSAPQWAG